MKILVSESLTNKDVGEGKKTFPQQQSKFGWPQPLIIHIDQSSDYFCIFIKNGCEWGYAVLSPALFTKGRFKSEEQSGRTLYPLM